MRIGVIGADAAALRRALADADRSRIAEYRAEEETRIGRGAPIPR